MTRKYKDIDIAPLPPTFFPAVSYVFTRSPTTGQPAGYAEGEIRLEGPSHVSFVDVIHSLASKVAMSTSAAGKRQEKLTARSEKHRASHFRYPCVSKFCSAECDACTPRYTHTRLIRSKFRADPPSPGTFAGRARGGRIFLEVTTR